MNQGDWCRLWLGTKQAFQRQEMITEANKYTCILNCVVYYPDVLIRLYYSDVIMSTMASQITGLTIVCSTVCLSENQRKPRSSASLAFVRGIHR